MLEARLFDYNASMTLLVFLFGLFVSGIVAFACALIAYGIHADHRERESRE